MNLTGPALAKFEDMIANGGRTITGIWRSTRNDITCNCVDGHHEVCSGWIFPIGGPAECACPCHDDDRPQYRVALAKALKVMNHWRINDFVTIDGSGAQRWKIMFVDYRAKEVHATGPTGQVAIAGFDTVILPGDPTPRLVVRTWFVMKNRDWAIQVEEGVNGRDDIYTYHASDERKATLLDRPGFGPFNRTYEVGDRVYYRFGQRDNQFGVVIGMSENPIDPTDRAYEIRSATSTGYAGPESMRYVDQPAFAVGQRWHCVTNDRYGTILEVDEIGLICEMRLEDTGTVGRFVLSAPFWEIAEDAPKA